MDVYLRQTRSATYAFWAAMPLLFAYEWLILVANRSSTMQIRVGADVWMKQFLASLGARGHLLLGALVAIIGLIIFFRERHARIELRSSYFVGMILESIVYAIVVTMVISTLIMHLFPAGLVMQRPLLAVGNHPSSLMLSLALSIGAGLYEELLFRVLIYGALYLVMRKLVGKPAPAMITATLVSALLFSAAHHIGSLGDPFTPAVFMYRFLYGIALQGLYLGRGFGIAAWTHALYDIMVVMIHGSL